MNTGSILSTKFTAKIGIQIDGALHHGIKQIAKPKIAFSRWIITPKFDSIIKRPRYSALCEDLNSFLWKPGEYSATAKVHIADTNETIEHNFSFALSELEVDTLHKNIEFTKSILEYEFIDSSKELNGAWLWAKPNIF